MGGGLRAPYEYHKAQQYLIRIVSIRTRIISSLRGNNAAGGFHHTLSLIYRKTADIDGYHSTRRHVFSILFKAFALICCQIPPPPKCSVLYILFGGAKA